MSRLETTDNREDALVTRDNLGLSWDKGQVRVSFVNLVFDSHNDLLDGFTFIFTKDSLSDYGQFVTHQGREVEPDFDLVMMVNSARSVFIKQKIRRDIRDRREAENLADELVYENNVGYGVFS